MTQLSEYNIQYLDDLKERVIHPYVYGHSFKFGGIDLVMASVHCFKVYESECPVDGSLNLGYEGIREVTRKVMESVKYNGYLPAPLGITKCDVFLRKKWMSKHYGVFRLCSI